MLVLQGQGYNGLNVDAGGAYLISCDKLTAVVYAVC